MSSSTSFLHIVDDAVKTAVFNRFGSYFNLNDQNRDLVFQPKIIAERKIAEKRGQTSVEFISLWRTRITPDWSRQRTSVSRDGIHLQYTDSSKTSIVTVRAIPVSIDYELRFWSRELDTLTQAVESYMKWFQDFPNLVVYYNSLYEMDMYMKLGEWLDETDYNVYEKGLYYVSQMPIHLDGWLMTDVNTLTIQKIIVNVYLRETLSGKTQDSFLDEFIITAEP